VSIPLAASAYPVECRSMLDMHRQRRSSSLASTLYHACDTHAAEGLAALVDEDIGGLDPVSPLLQFSAPGNSRHQNEPAPYFTSCYLLVGRGPLGERNRPIDHWWSECAILKEWRECLKHGCGFGRVAFAGVDAKQLPLIVVKVAKVEADTTIAYRCNFDLPPAMS
jgi:hypothetical protein